MLYPDSEKLPLALTASYLPLCFRVITLFHKTLHIWITNWTSHRVTYYSISLLFIFASLSFSKFALAILFSQTKCLIQGWRLFRKPSTIERFPPLLRRSSLTFIISEPLYHSLIHSISHPSSHNKSSPRLFISLSIYPPDIFFAITSSFSCPSLSNLKFLFTTWLWGTSLFRSNRFSHPS